MQVDNARLTLFNCRIHGVAAPLCGVSVEKGVLRMEGVTMPSVSFSTPASTICTRQTSPSVNRSSILMCKSELITQLMDWAANSFQAFANNSSLLYLGNLRNSLWSNIAAKVSSRQQTNIRVRRSPLN